MIERLSKLGSTVAVSSAKSGEGSKAPLANPRSASTGATSLPKLINLARELAERGPPVDYAKIAQIRQAIAQGTYKIDAEAIASAILRNGSKPSQ